jgi:hypothetical protein
MNFIIIGLIENNAIISLKRFIFKAFEKNGLAL